jgi:putative endonuclease
MPRTFYVYILANRSRTLYVGITNDIHRRVLNHREGKASDFTRRYMIRRLVYVEVTTDVRAAIAREKEIKGWLREKKIALIESANPEWEDLADEWFDDIPLPGA